MLFIISYCDYYIQYLQCILVGSVGGGVGMFQLLRNYAVGALTDITTTTTSTAVTSSSTTSSSSSLKHKQDHNNTTSTNYHHHQHTVTTDFTQGIKYHIQLDFFDKLSKFVDSLRNVGMFVKSHHQNLSL